MGRKPTRNTNLPPQMRARVRGDTTYYYYDTGARPRKEIPLGKDYVQAVREWSKLHGSKTPDNITVGYLSSQYLASADYHGLGHGTQADYKFAIDKIVEYFGDAPIAQVKPPHIQLYLDKRGATSKHRAHREVSIFGMLYRYAMARGWCTLNPVAPIKRKRLPGRKGIEITDAMLDAVYQAGSIALREAIDLAYYLSQRPADVLKVSETDIKDGALAIIQNKTGKALRIPVVGGLAELIDRIHERKKAHPVRVLALLVDEHGVKMTKAKLRSRFEAARAAAGIPGHQFQFRDLRRKGSSDLRLQVGIEAAQSLLGHSSLEMTEHYTAAAGTKVRAIPARKKT